MQLNGITCEHILQRKKHYKRSFNFKYNLILSGTIQHHLFALLPLLAKQMKGQMQVPLSQALCLT